MMVVDFGVNRLYLNRDLIHGKLERYE